MSNKREYAIGDTVQMGLVTLVCEEDNSHCNCTNCYARTFAAGQCEEIFGNCLSISRKDNTTVNFKLKEEYI